ncbi:MAG: UDP-glucose/GDP-mannose dehydrogenase family protein [Patescibacteria group bacterium]
MNIYIIGAGWVGLVTAGVFAEHHWVTVVDVNTDCIALLKSGKIPFFEPDLQELLQKGVQRGNILFLDSLDSSLGIPDVIFCAVGTPQAADGRADLSAVILAAQECEQKFPGCIFVVKSTVPPGTCAMLGERFPNLSFASNPEFLAEGTAVRDALFPSRIVFGAHDQKTLDVLTKVYASWQQEGVAIITTDCVTSELAKYAANAFLATKISFVNEMSEFAEEVGADMRIISKSMGYDSRIGSKFLVHGLGYGGSCFPKDTQALLATARDRHISLPLVHEAEARNTRQRARFLEKIVRAHRSAGGRGHVAVLGVAYKAGTDDTRSAPALEIIAGLLAQDIPVRWFDPMVQEIGLPVGRSIGLDEACASALVVFVATEWPEILAYAEKLPQESVLWGRHPPAEG